MVSIIVTTYKTDTLYTQACLEAIRRWKNSDHELIVVTHDESLLLRLYLQSCKADGLIDKLIYAVPGHGHTKGFNLAVKQSTGDVIFNICNDICVGGELIQDCVAQLRSNKQIGMLGWFWYEKGVHWNNGKITEAR